MVELHLKIDELVPVRVNCYLFKDLIISSITSLKCSTFSYKS